ncbi:U2 small nuclear ribonucleoprotein auxiliary factor 35 kDa subunit-related protein 1-like [Betta splendens]|uniref:U2 small nuclear ribonucleoprotein auxiliary factor 35 kDa subunit-related protein 1-like n=1 Tax=Betta splendens TaxID=158456 RepID=A0A8M1HHX1_BETSP|nr:U2 small nuclear ribonucleoprotein auxiliary factor 35 kDa subunit-related protein 1-like [Betta splendens]XP_055367392.1 U2 small nuclear ribonucleoprotein auxiliary factor 35 kDa subunit-related protein 1-like [Betta splendens]
MTHVKRFREIPMSKSMRGLCKEEDYAFLGMSGETTKEAAEGAGASEGERRDKRDGRVHGQQEWERQQREKLRGKEEREEEKDLQRRTRVPEPASVQEKTLQDRLARLRKFREFQRKVLVEESGTDGETLGAHGQLAPHQDADGTRK